MMLNGSSLTDDLSTANNDVSNAGSVSILNTTGPYGTTQDVLDFDRTSSNSHLKGAGGETGITDLDDGDPWTMECWVMLDDLGADNGSSTLDVQGVFGVGTTNTQNSGIVVRWKGTQWYWWVGGWGLQSTFTRPRKTGQWQHIALVYDGVSSSTLYVDGVASTAGNRACALGASDKVVLGRQYPDFAENPLDGKIADFRITKGVMRYTSNFTPPTASFPTNAPVVGRRGVGEIDNSIEYLIVGGGGGGGNDVASGGGAGGVIAGSSTTLLNSGSYSISIGSGGTAGPTAGTTGSNGGDTSALGLTAIGGGGGGGPAGGDGGSGGGGNPVGSGTSGQGNDGGLPLQSTPYFNGGGGGGKTSAGGDATTSKGGDGGDGILWLDGNYYGGGGGGGWLHNSSSTAGSLDNRGLGGLGGGGSGGVSSYTTVVASAANGAANTGGGGGGGGWQNGGNNAGGDGGSGVVLLRYPSSVTLSISAGLTYTNDTTTAPGYTITKFTSGSGTVELSGDPATTLRTRGYIGAAPVRGGMLTLCDRLIARSAGLSEYNPAIGPSEVASLHNTSGVYWINPDVTGWNTARRCWVDVDRNGGGWVLWIAKYGTASMEVRSYFSEYSDATYDLSERTDPSTTGHQSHMWAILNGSTELWWVNNISGQSSLSAGSYVTSVLHVEENGTAMNSDVNYWNMDAPTTSCPIATGVNGRRYDYTVTSTDSGWYNGHSTLVHTCSGWEHQGNQYVGNWVAASDNNGAYAPGSRLFGNGPSGYYAHGNAYDHDLLDFSGSSEFRDVQISSHSSNSNQVWLRW
jgi:hypothetical protein